MSHNQDALAQTPCSHPTGPLRVWVLSDGRPGHYSQSQGIVRALAKRWNVETHWIEVRLRLGIYRNMLRPMLNRSRLPRVPPFPLIDACYRVGRRPATRPDVIISAGGNTSMINAWLASAYRCSNVYAGSLRGLSAGLFSAVLTLRPIPNAVNNLVVELAPTPIEPSRISAAGTQFRIEQELGDEPLWAMIVGGDGAGYQYEEGDWRQIARGMARLSRRFAIRWLLTTSRRTGVAAEQCLERELPCECLADAVYFARHPRKVMQAYLGAARYVFCTEDSGTMLTEAISAGKPVFTLSPRRAAPDPQMAMYLDRHETSRRLGRLTIAQLADFHPQQGDSLQPLTVSVVDDLAGRLPNYLPFDRGAQAA